MENALETEREQQAWHVLNTILGSLNRAGMTGVCTGLDIGLALAVAREFNYDAAFVADVLADAEDVIVNRINEKPEE